MFPVRAQGHPWLRPLRCPRALSGICSMTCWVVICWPAVLPLSRSCPWPALGTVSAGAIRSGAGQGPRRHRRGTRG